MDAGHFKIQMLFHGVAFLKTPAVKKLPNLVPRITAKPPVFIAPFILTHKSIDAVFLFVKLTPGKAAQAVAGINVIFGILLFLHQILFRRQRQIFYCHSIGQVDHQRVAKFLIKVRLDRLKRRRKLLLPA